MALSKSVNILFYVCSHRGDIRQKQKAKTYNYYLYQFPHRTMNNRFDNISDNISIIKDNTDNRTTQHPRAARIFWANLFFSFRQLDLISER